MNPVSPKGKLGFFLSWVSGKTLITKVFGRESVVASNKKIKIRVKSRPPKGRKVWGFKPAARVKPADRAKRLERLRERELREGH